MFVNVSNPFTLCFQCSEDFCYLVPVLLEAGLAGEVARVVDGLQLPEDPSAGEHIHGFDGQQRNCHFSHTLVQSCSDDTCSQSVSHQCHSVTLVSLHRTDKCHTAVRRSAAQT